MRAYGTLLAGAPRSVAASEAVTSDMIPYLVWALVPPLVMFALGLIASWIVSGFRRPIS